MLWDGAWSGNDSNLKWHNGSMDSTRCRQSVDIIVSAETLHISA